MDAARQWAVRGEWDCDVWVEHRTTLEAWLTVCDQWRLMEWSGRAPGLDWPAVKVLLNAAGIAFDAALLDGLRMMERTTLQVWREERG